ncbi:ExeA family protein [Saccharospirillum alexandrii]|uniref:ExeA family protein n=1 Tax=Saccharospirillum alexandrii TaxID=2448477 RepID=UPI000FD9E23B|nr:AAA family ATPase [Saccharospirillum alexandrii]
MYEAHFGLKQPPFSLSPDTALFVRLDDHEACYQLLTHVLDTGEGFLKVIGDVGTGKTILCRRLLRFLSDDEAARERFHSVYIPNPMLSPVGLYRAVGQELGLETPLQADNAALLEHINQKILDLAQQQRGVVIVVDEAQSLPPATLEALRLITNLETERQKLVQVILFGQPELDELLDQNRFRQLRQRITFAHYLKPLSRTAIRQYLDFRLTQSGYNGPTLVTDRAIKRLHQLSGGIPRMINVLTHKALLSAYADQRRQVNPADFDRAWRDSKPETPRLTARVAPLATMAAVLLLAAVSVWSLL